MLIAAEFEPPVLEAELEAESEEFDRIGDLVGEPNRASGCN